jgi:uncharacterized protein YlbG (UPF0298 family)
MQNEINALIALTDTTLNSKEVTRKEILEQILRCEYLLTYIQKAERKNHISKAQQLHCEIQVLSLSASLEKILKKTFDSKNDRKNVVKRLTSEHHAK